MNAEDLQKSLTEAGVLAIVEAEVEARVAVRTRELTASAPALLREVSRWRAEAERAQTERDDLKSQLRRALERAEAAEASLRHVDNALDRVKAYLGGAR